MFNDYCFVFREFVYKLLFSTVVDGKILRSSEFSSFTVEELAAIKEMTTPKGGFYEIYDMTGRSLLDYRSAFNILMYRPILSLDQTAILASLRVEWQKVKPDVASTIEITFGNQEEYLNSNG